MSTIFQDSVSVYVRYNGSIIRPLPAAWDFGRGVQVTQGPVLYDGTWRYVGDRPVEVTIGDKVPVKMIGHSPFYLIDNREVWTSHGEAEYWNGSKQVRWPSDTRYAHGQRYGYPCKVCGEHATHQLGPDPTTADHVCADHLPWDDKALGDALAAAAQAEIDAQR